MIVAPAVRSAGLIFTSLKVVIALAVFVGISRAGLFVVRAFGMVPPAEPEARTLRAVSYRYRCAVCGTEVTMTAAPDDAVPTAPRHCREDMNLVVEGGEYEDGDY